MRDADAARAEALDLGRREVDAVRAPDVPGEPADALEVLDRRAAVELAAVRLLLDRLGEVRVELQPEPAGERGRLLHQARRDRERRARRDGDLDQVAVGERGEPLGVGEDVVDVLDELVGRQAAVGVAEIHRAARGDDPHAELARGRSSASTRPVTPRGKT